MADDPNTTDWAPGGLPPWLAAYGAPPVAQAPLQPGLGVPAAAVDAAASSTLPPGPDLSQPTPDELAAVPADVAPDGPVVDPYAGGGMPNVVAGPVTMPSEAPVNGVQTVAGGPGPIGLPTHVDQAPGAIMMPDQSAGPTRPSEGAALVNAPNAPLPAYHMGGLTPQSAYEDFISKDATPESQKLDLDQMTDADKAKAVEKMTPEQVINYANDRNASMLSRQAAAQAKADADNHRRQQENYDDQMAAYAQTNADMAQLKVDAIAQSQKMVNPHDYTDNRGIGGAIRDVLLATIGGAVSQSTGGRNLALEQFNKKIENNIQSQKDNIANGWKGIDARKGLISEGLAQHGDMFRAQETYRIGAYESAIRSMQTDLQQYDPAGATALAKRGQIDQFHQAQQQALQGIAQQTLTNNLAKRKDAREDFTAESTARHADEDLAQKQLEFNRLHPAGGIGGLAGAGGTNPKYTVPTGLFDPVTKAPIMGRAKVEKPAEVQAQLTAYTQTQNAYARMAAIARKIDGMRGVGGQISGRLSSTDEQEYDQARTELLSERIKAAGGRVNKDSLDAEGALVPDLQKTLGQADSQKMIADSMQANDESFVTGMNTMGVDPSPTVQAFQAKRAASPMPTNNDALDAAQSAVAKNPTGKDEQRALADAQAKIAAGIQHKQDATAAIATVRQLDAARPHMNIGDDAPPEVQAAAVARDNAADTYNQLLAKYHKLQSDHAAGASKLKGDVDAAGVKHDDAIAEAALAIVQQKAVLDAATAMLARIPSQHYTAVRPAAGPRTFGDQ